MTQNDHPLDAATSEYFEAVRNYLAHEPHRIAAEGYLANVRDFLAKEVWNRPATEYIREVLAYLDTGLTKREFVSFPLQEKLKLETLSEHLEELLSPLTEIVEKINPDYFMFVIGGVYESEHDAFAVTLYRASDSNIANNVRTYNFWTPGSFSEHPAFRQNLYTDPYPLFPQEGIVLHLEHLDKNETLTGGLQRAINAYSTLTTIYGWFITHHRFIAQRDHRRTEYATVGGIRRYSDADMQPYVVEVDYIAIYTAPSEQGSHKE